MVPIGGLEKPCLPVHDQVRRCAAFCLAPGLPQAGWFRDSGTNGTGTPARRQGYAVGPDRSSRQPPTA